MRGAPINVFNRYTGKPFEEAIYGGKSLRFAYESRTGRLMTRQLISRAFFSRIYGWLMDRPRSARKIRPFIEQYQVDESEFAHPVDSFATFNEFFMRTLKPEARPIDADPDSVVFPADGRHMGWERLGTETSVFVKGQRWDLSALLGGDPELVARFTDGSLVISRLCPVDYHHFHYPVGGRAGKPKPVGNRLYSVSPLALRTQLSYLWANKRILTRIRTDGCGDVLFIEVGATNVGSIRHRPMPEDGVVTKGEAKGCFAFGGSTVITLFEKGKVQLSPDLLECSGQVLELYARCGDRMGKFIR